MIEQRTYAKGRSWWVTAEKPQGGFVLVREDAIYSAWAALCDAKIELRDFRIWLASFEVLERHIGLRADRKPTLTEIEFRRLVGGVGREHFRTSVRRLERAGLGQWREHAINLPGSRSGKGNGGGRLVPIPRPMLRYLARSTGRGRSSQLRWGTSFAASTTEAASASREDIANRRGSSTPLQFLPER